MAERVMQGGGNNHDKSVIKWMKGLTWSDSRPEIEPRHPGTCEWLFQHPLYTSWIKAKDPREFPRLLLVAPPGSGKTILASTVAENFRMAEHRTISFFFSFTDPARRTAGAAFRSLAVDLAAHHSRMPDKVLQLFFAATAKGGNGIEDFGTTITVVKGLLRSIPRIHIILDGLDECQDRRQRLLPGLAEIMSAPTLGNVKWFLTSRPEKEIQRPLAQCHVKELLAPSECLNHDIGGYLRDCCDDSESLSVKDLTDESQGNFLYAKLMLRQHHNKASTVETESEDGTSGDFPRGINGLYLRDLHRLDKRGPQQNESARRIFAYLVAAIQPLRLSELSHALGTAGGSADFVSDLVPRREQIEELSASFLVFDPSPHQDADDPLVQFAHKTVYDFFVQDTTSIVDPSDTELYSKALDSRHDEREWRELFGKGVEKMGAPGTIARFFTSQELANQELGEACLRYLSYTRYHRSCDQVRQDRNGQHAFLKYAATFWHRHLSMVRPTIRMYDRTQDFLRSPAFWNCIVTQARVTPQIFAVYVKEAEHYRPTDSGTKGPDGSQEENLYGMPLPEWLDTPDARDCHEFVGQWYHVLNSHPEGINQCRMDEQWEARWPHIRDRMLGRVRRQNIRLPSARVPSIGYRTDKGQQSDFVDEGIVADLSSGLDGHRDNSITSGGEIRSDGVEQMPSSNTTAMHSKGDDAPSPQTVFREAHFSDTHGHTFHLAVTLHTANTGVKLILSLSTSKGCQDVQSSIEHSETPHACVLNYYSSTAAGTPLVLTAWSSDYVLVALLPLSCDPKIVRLALSEAMVASMPPGLTRFQTLRRPVFFPSITCEQNPTLELLSREGEEEDILTLRLGAGKMPSEDNDQMTPETEGAVFHGRCLMKPEDRVSRRPHLMTWNLHRSADWREWDEANDARPVKGESEGELMERLRGSYVSQGQNFCVSVVSGLDWRKKAFLSCF